MEFPNYPEHAGTWTDTGEFVLDICKTLTYIIIFIVCILQEHKILCSLDSL